MKGQVGKFEKYITENESKRRRAVLKYQQEVKSKEQRNKEFDVILGELEEIKQKYVPSLTLH